MTNSWLWHKEDYTISMALFAKQGKTTAVYAYKKRRGQICNLILASLASGEAKLFQAGLDKPNENIQKCNNNIRRLNLFTSVVLKYHTSKTIDFTLEDKTLIHFFVRLFKESDGVMITGDNTRTLIDVEKYRQVILEGRKYWLPDH